MRGSRSMGAPLRVPWTLWRRETVSTLIRTFLMTKTVTVAEAATATATKNKMIREFRDGLGEANAAV